MSKNYLVIHYIQQQLKDFNPKFVDCVVRSFNYLEAIKADRDCLTNTIALFLCAKKLEYNPNICYGLCKFQDKPFYHVWLEINEIIIDIAVYGNVNYSEYSMWDCKLETPYIGKYEYSPIYYGKFKFDEDWKDSLISKIEGWTVLQYMNAAPQNAMWKLVCKFLDITPTSQVVDELSSYIKDIKIERPVDYDK